jgi:RND family efflux transporter MFP subunit
MTRKTWYSIFVLTLIAGALGWLIFNRMQELDTGAAKREKEKRPVPVEIARIQQGSIEDRRVFSGSLQAWSELIVAPKIAGRVEQLKVDLADPVDRGQLVARLDNDEHQQAVHQAEAELAVAKAKLTEAQSLLKIAKRELQRIDELRRRGLSSESQIDTAKADHLAGQAHVEVTRAQLSRARAELETARIRLGYTEVKANWREGNDQRLVAERLVDEGETVSANTPLLRIVELDPIKAVIFVTEKEYALLRAGQQAKLTADAHLGESFQGEIERIAPVFRENSRQARVELRMDNPRLKLKPGMFVSVTLVLERAEGVSIIPEQAPVTRKGEKGVFLLNQDRSQVTWQPIRLGIRQDDRIQVKDGHLSGWVITLGQQLLDDGSLVRIAGEKSGMEP